MKRIAALIVVAIGLSIACAKSDDAKQAAIDVKNKAVDKAVDVKDTAVDKATAVKNAATDKASDVKNAAADVGTQVVDTLSAGYTRGKRVKAELDKVYKTTHDYDLIIDDVSAASPEGEAHAKKLAGLPTVKVGDVSVGYEDDVARSVGGVTRSKHVRASWRRGDKIIRVSYMTSERFDAVAFAELLQRLVPIAERVL